MIYFDYFFLKIWVLATREIMLQQRVLFRHCYWCIHIKQLMPKDKLTRDNIFETKTNLLQIW